MATFILLTVIAFCQHETRGQFTRSDSQVARPIAVESFVQEFSSTASNDAGWSRDWVLSRTAPALRARTSPAELTDFGAEIRGTKERNNPLRRQLSKPFDGAELFVRFLISYDDKSIDKAPQSDGEFFVLWLDSEDGGDTATHSSGVPNIGLHVDSQNRNAFMVRFGPDSSSFSTVELAGDRTFLVVARVAK